MTGSTWLSGDVCVLFSRTELRRLLHSALNHNASSNTADPLPETYLFISLFPARAWIRPVLALPRVRWGLCSWKCLAQASGTSSEWSCLFAASIRIQVYFRGGEQWRLECSHWEIQQHNLPRLCTEERNLEANHCAKNWRSKQNGTILPRRRWIL